MLTSSGSRVAFRGFSANGPNQSAASTTSPRSETHSASTPEGIRSWSMPGATFSTVLGIFAALRFYLVTTLGERVRAGCTVTVAEDTRRFPDHVDLYLDMLNKQLTYDALKIIGFDVALMQELGGEMTFVRQLAHEGKICQGMFVATIP